MDQFDISRLLQTNHSGRDHKSSSTVCDLVLGPVASFTTGNPLHQPFRGCFESDNDGLQQLPESNRMNTTDQLVLAVSHRINNLFHSSSGGEFLVDTALKSNDLDRVAEGWSIVKRLQNRISQLSSNLCIYCINLELLLRKLNLYDQIEAAADEVGNSFDKTRLKISHQFDSDLKLNLDSHFCCQAIANILTVALMASEDGEDGQDEVTLETSMSDKSVLIRVGFRHFDDRFDLVQLMAAVDQINKLKAGLGMLELLVTRKIVEGHSGTIKGVTKAANHNWIEVRLPKTE